MIEILVVSVTDDNFTPLHLAAALYLPCVCHSLLDDKVDLHLKSVWGSPLEFATAGPTFFDDTETSHFGSVLNSHFGLDRAIAVKDKLATMELLVGAGTEPTYSRSRLGTNLLDLSFRFAAETRDLSGATKLMSLGVKLGPQSPHSFRICIDS